MHRARKKTTKNIFLSVSTKVPHHGLEKRKRVGRKEEARRRKRF